MNYRERVSHDFILHKKHCAWEQQELNYIKYMTSKDTYNKFYVDKS